MTVQKFHKVGFKTRLLRQKAKVTLTEPKVGSKVESWAISYGNMSWERTESFKELGAI